MQQLLDLIANEFCDSDGWFRITSADWHADTLRLEVVVSFAEEQQTQRWQIWCESVFEEQLSSDYAESLTLTAEHPLLVKFKEPEVEVAFSRNTMSAEQLFGIVATSCFKYLGEQPLSNWINQQASSQGICASEYGLLGRFPLSVANEITGLLSDKAISVNQLAPRPPTYWNGTQFCDYPSNIELLMIGSSYIVGVNFKATRA